MSYKKQLDNMIWSFSRVHSWEQCAYYFYKHYICGELGETNWFADNGSAAHLTMEKLLKHEISLEEAPSFYLEQADLICSSTKQTTMDKTIESIMDYLCMVEPLNEEKYEILGVEDKFNFKIGDYDFVGFADFIIKDKTNGEVILGDHKSCAKILKKDGTPYANQKKNFENYKKQMYIYCIGMQIKYGFYPQKLLWHHFKTGEIDVIPFDESEIDKVKEWAISTIQKIYKDKRFDASLDYFMCHNLCDYRAGDCEYLEEE